MLTPTVIEPELLSELVMIGRDRLPNEACGVIIPQRWHGRQVFEMPNRSLTPRDHFDMRSEDIGIALQDWVNDHQGQVAWEQITLWHTHPSGEASPSQMDIDNRVPNCGNLVIALGDNPRATWF